MHSLHFIALMLALVPQHISVGKMLDRFCVVLKKIGTYVLMLKCILILVFKHSFAYKIITVPFEYKKQL